MRQLAEPDEVLLEHGLVEAVLVVELRELGMRGPRTEHSAGRAARQQVEQDEHDQ